MGLPLPRRMRPETKPGHANNRTVAHLRANRQSFAPGVLVSRTTVGTFQRAKRVFGSAAPASPSDIKVFRIRQVKPDYLVCNGYSVTFDASGNATASIESTDTLIAKSYKLRTTPFNGQSVGGVQYTYDLSLFPKGDTRTATFQQVSETQLVTPDYVIGFGGSYSGDLILAIKNPQGGTGVKDSTNTEIEWLDLNCDGRVWAEKY